MLGIFLCETFGSAHAGQQCGVSDQPVCGVHTVCRVVAPLRRRPWRRAMFGFAAASLLGAALLSGGYTGRWGWGDALMLAAAVPARHHGVPDHAAHPPPQCAGAGPHGGAVGRHWGGLPAAGTGFAGQAAPAAVAHPGQRFLVGLHLPGGGLHGVCVCGPELGTAPQLAHAGGLADQQRNPPLARCLRCSGWESYLSVTGWVGGALIVGAALWTMAAGGCAPDALPTRHSPQALPFLIAAWAYGLKLSRFCDSSSECW